MVAAVIDIILGNKNELPYIISHIYSLPYICKTIVQWRKCPVSSAFLWTPYDQYSFSYM